MSDSHNGGRVSSAMLAGARLTRAQEDDVLRRLPARVRAFVLYESPVNLCVVGVLQLCMRAEDASFEGDELEEAVLAFLREGLAEDHRRLLAEQGVTQ